jgi:myo-inositol 2-dehydrogenase/D-chiro-inositol 1-dehydrogenase
MSRDAGASEAAPAERVQCRGMERRTLLAGAAASLAGQVAGQKAELRTAQIGVGNRGTALLRQVLKQANVRVAAICDIDAQARDTALSAASTHNPRSFTDYRQVLDLTDIDAVFVATPCDLHAPMAIAALQAGKYVYCEKPVGITPEQVANVLKAARGAKTFLQIGQQLRYYPTMRESMRQIHELRTIGEPFVIQAQRNSTPPAAGTARPRPAWYDDVKRSGDLIVENAVHNLDACNWAANSRPESAYGHGKKYLPVPSKLAGTAFLDGFSVDYIYENGMNLSYSQLYLHPRSLKELRNGQWYMVFGEKGAIEINSGTFYPMHETEPKKFFTPEIEKASENATEEFFACIREKRQPFADIKVAATAALTAIMGREAIYRRKMVTWKELGVEV